MLDLTEGELQQAVLTLEELHRQKAWDSLPIDQRSWMAGLGREEIRLLWYCGQPGISYVQIAHQMGCSRDKVARRIRALKAKLKLTRTRYQHFARAVVQFHGELARSRGDSIAPVEPIPPKAA